MIVFDLTVDAMVGCRGFLAVRRVVTAATHPPPGE